MRTEDLVAELQQDMEQLMNLTGQLARETAELQRRPNGSGGAWVMTAVEQTAARLRKSIHQDCKAGMEIIKKRTELSRRIKPNESKASPQYQKLAREFAVVQDRFQATAKDTLASQKQGGGSGMDESYGLVPGNGHVFGQSLI